MARSNVKAIRADVKARLLAANTAAGNRVYVSRILPLSPEDVADGPAIVFGVLAEKHEEIGPAPLYRTTATCTLDCYATDADETALQDVLDDLVEQVEGVLFAGAFRDQFNAITSIEVQSAAEQLEDATQLFGRIGMRWDCTYTTVFVATEPRPLFNAAHLNFDFEGGTNPDVVAIVEAP